jgi:NAD(P)-dependent dehydrogenase (short-subunit alcohol dehydrogenase family)
MPRIDLRDKPICITGASSGIGRMTALRCADAGMPVVACARRDDRLGELVDEITSRGGRATAVRTDVNDADACRNAVDETVREFGSIYAVFANAGYGFEAASHETDDERLRAIFETNFFGTMNIVRPAAERMLQAGAGHVLICSSCIGKMALPYFGAYCATKAAQNHMGRAMNLELRPHGVFTSTIHPVGTKTDFFDTAKKLTHGDAISLEDHAPSWFMQTPETVARAIVACLRKPKPEVWPSWSWFVRWSMGLCTMFPTLADLGTRRLVTEYEREQKQRRDQPAAS